MGISIDTVRVGKKYRLVNYGDKTEFEVLEKISDNDFLIKDLVSLDVYHFQRLVFLGKGSDYNLEEF